jgi:Helix-turn-helix domain
MIPRGRSSSPTRPPQSRRKRTLRPAEPRWSEEVHDWMRALPKLLTVREAARTSRHPVQDVYAACRSGDLVTCKIGRLIRIETQELARWTRRGAPITKPGGECWLDEWPQ